MHTKMKVQCSGNSKSTTCVCSEYIHFMIYHNIEWESSLLSLVAEIAVCVA